MNNTQLYFAVMVPTFTVIIGILVNLWNSNRIEHNLTTRIDRLEDQLNAIRDLLIGKVIEHGERIAKLEPK